LHKKKKRFLRKFVEVIEDTTVFVKRLGNAHKTGSEYSLISMGKKKFWIISKVYFLY